MSDFSFPLLKLLALSSLEAGYILGCLITGSFGLFALIFAFLKWQRITSLNWLKAASRAKKQAWKKLKIPLSHHSWMEDLASATDCKCVAQFGNGEVQHRWSERWISLDENPEMSAFCFYCDDPCGIPFVDASPAWHCLWCQRLIHVECQVKMSEESSDICDLGALRRVILSPLCVKDESVSSVTNGRIVSSVHGHIKRKQHPNRHGNNRCINGKVAESFGSKTALQSVLKDLVGLTNSSNEKRNENYVKATKPLGNKGTLNGLSNENDEMAVCGKSKKCILVDLSSDARPLLVFINAKSVELEMVRFFGED